MVHGEVYEIRESLLPMLDLIEGYPTLYLRKTVETSLGPALAYVMTAQPRNSVLVPSGRWDG